MMCAGCSTWHRRTGSNVVASALNLGDVMRLPSVLYSVYERRLARSLPTKNLPCHVGVILDGNRRWAKTFGASAATGHRRGADKSLDLLTGSPRARAQV